MSGRLMVIDDHEDTLDLLREVLTLEGYQVDAIPALHPDLREVVGAMPDLLVVDLRLTHDEAGLTGWDVVRLARAHRRLRTMPILVISADVPTLNSHIAEASRMDGVQLLTKPFPLDGLLALVADGLRSRRQSPRSEDAAHGAAAAVGNEP